jgi:hypothetical protein
MNREYDAFEVLPNGVMVWKAKIVGQEDAVKKLKEVAKDNANEFQLVHIPTKTVIAKINSKSAEQHRRLNPA